MKTSIKALLVLLVLLGVLLKFTMDFPAHLSVTHEHTKSSRRTVATLLLGEFPKDPQARLKAIEAITRGSVVPGRKIKGFQLEVGAERLRVPGGPTSARGAIQSSDNDADTALTLGRRKERRVVDELSAAYVGSVPNCSSSPGCRHPGCMAQLVPLTPNGELECVPNPSYQFGSIPPRDPSSYGYAPVEYSEIQCEASPAEVVSADNEDTQGGKVQPKTVPEPIPAEQRLPTRPLLPPQDGSPLDAFKYFTAKPFENWFDWKGSCPAVSEATDHTHQTTPTVAELPSELRGFHDTTGGNNVYRLENVCFRPFGNVAGYNPRIEPFKGVDDVFRATKEDRPMEPFKRFLGAVEHLSLPPTCFLDTPLLLMPMITRSNNPGHVFHRMASLLDVAKHAFPKASYSNLTTAYLFLTGNNTEVEGDPHDLSHYHRTAFPQFQSTVSATHFALYGTWGPSSATMTTTSVGSRKVSDELLNQARHQGIFEAVRSILGPHFSDSRLTEPVCFRSVAVYMSCTAEECSTPNRQLDNATAPKTEATQRSDSSTRPIIPLYGERDPELLQRYANRLRTCARAPARRASPDRLQPRILYSTRSGTRLWTLNPLIISSLVSLTASRNVTVGSLSVVEMNRFSTLELVRLFSAADIVIGPYGAGLFYSIFMPPHTVVVEVNHNEKACAKSAGMDVAANAECDYGGNLAVMGIHHAVYPLSANADLRKDGSLDVAPSLVTFAVQKALCYIQAPALGKSPSGLCAFSDREVQLIQEMHRRDEDGAAFRSLLQLQQLGVRNSKHQGDSKRSQTALTAWLQRNANGVAKALSAWRHPVIAPKGQPAGCTGQGCTEGFPRLLIAGEPTLGGGDETNELGIVTAVLVQYLTRQIVVGFAVSGATNLKSSLAGQRRASRSWLPVDFACPLGESPSGAGQLVDTSMAVLPDCGAVDAALTDDVHLIRQLRKLLRHPRAPLLIMSDDDPPAQGNSRVLPPDRNGRRRPSGRRNNL